MSPSNNAKHAQQFFGYWQGFTESGDAPLFAPPLRETPLHVNIVAIAFAVPGVNSTLITTYVTSQNNTEHDIIADTEILQNRGQKVVMSINGNPKMPWASLQPIQFAESISQLAKQWKLDGVDLDYETYGTQPGQHFVSVIKAIRDKMGNDFIISYPAYIPFRDSFLTSVQDEISLVMTMAYWNDEASAIALFETYENLLGGPEKLMIGIKPGIDGENQSTPIAAVPGLAQYKPKAGDKAGIMLYSLSLDFHKYTSQGRFHWTSLIQQHL